MKTLWMTAAPQKTMPSPMTMEVTMAGVSWKWRKVKRTIPIRKSGMERKKPAMAQVRVIDAFLRYLVVLSNKYRFIHVKFK